MDDRNLIDRDRIFLGEVLDYDIFTSADPLEAKVRDDFTFQIEDFRKHLLILGDTGSGKTVTTFQVLHGLHDNKIPFIIFECAKREYRNLKKSFNILHFTPGNEIINPYRLNFLEVPPGVHVQPHIEAIVSAFEHAYNMPHPMPMILEESLATIYEMMGWDITLNKRPEEKNAYPTLTMLQEELPRTFQRRVKGAGYSGEVSTNLISALITRVADIQRWGRGSMFNCHRSIPMDELYTKNIVFELQSLGDDSRRKLFVSIFLSVFFEFLQAQGMQEELKHVIVIEEAHRILGGAYQINPDGGAIGYKTVQTIQDLIAESRALGEGIIIIDQNPQGLPNPILATARSIIAHSLKSKINVDCVCNHFRQIPIIPNLRTGRAIVVTPNEFIGKVQILPFERSLYDISNEEIKLHMTAFYTANPWIKNPEIDRVVRSHKDLLLGISLPGVDETCAKIEFQYLIQDKNPNNPFYLQDKIYFLSDKYRRAIERLFQYLNVEAYIDDLQLELNKIHQSVIESEGLSSSSYHKIMSLMTQNFGSFIPIAAITYFLRLLIFKFLKFDNVYKPVILFRQLIKNFATSGTQWIDPDNEIYSLY